MRYKKNLLLTYFLLITNSLTYDTTGELPVAFELDGVVLIINWMDNDLVQEPAAARPHSVVPNTNPLQLLQRHRFHDELVHLFQASNISLTFD